MDATQGSLGQGVGGHQSQAVDPHLVDTVYRLERVKDRVNAVENKGCWGADRVTGTASVKQKTMCFYVWLGGAEVWDFFRDVRDLWVRLYPHAHQSRMKSPYMI